MQPLKATAEQTDRKEWIAAWKARMAGDSKQVKTETTHASGNSQEDLRKMWTDREDNGLAMARYPVMAVRLIKADGAEVPQGSVGTLEGGLIRWEDGLYTASAVVGRDFQIDKRTGPPPDPLLKEMGKEVSKEALQKAFSDLSGLSPGDMAAVHRADGKWIYAQLVGARGSTRTGTKGISWSFGVGAGKKQMTIQPQSKEELEKVKQFKEPKIGNILPGGLRSYSLLEDKLGEEVPEDVLQKASSDLSGMCEYDVAIVEANGKWRYAQVIERRGSDQRSGTGAGTSLTFVMDQDGARRAFGRSDWDSIKQLKQPVAGMGVLQDSPLKPIEESLTAKLLEENTNPLMFKIGEECSPEDLQKASVDRSRLQTGDVVALRRSDGKWTYARLLERTGASRSGTSGTSLLFRVAKDGSYKKIDAEDWDESVKTLAKQS
jgi:hypothetical protein